MEMYVLITQVFVELDSADLKNCTQVSSDKASKMTSRHLELEDVYVCRV